MSALQIDPVASSPVSTASDRLASETAIEVSHVSKYYKIYDDFISGPIKERLFPWRAERYFKRFAAVCDVSFSIQRGQVVGILGPNGSGKTTLLKCVAGLLAIDEGEIAVRGRVTTLLSTGVGSHPEFSGRENIFFGGLTLGMTRQQIEEKVDSIIKFSELGEYIERPLRTYSAGMRARLLFSIAMSGDPDILIVDEALGAGDSYFVRKCERRFREICASGATVLFVSHNTTQIEELCSHAIFMVGGKVVDQGPPPQVNRLYYDWVFEKEKKDIERQFALEPPDMSKSGGSGEVVLDQVTLHDQAGAATVAFYAGEPMTIRLHYRCSHGPIRGVRVFCGILVRPTNTFVGEMDSSFHYETTPGGEKETLLDLDDAGVIEMRLDPLTLINNDYALWIKLYTKEDTIKELCDYRGVAPFFATRRFCTTNRGPMFWHPFRIATVAKAPGEVGPMSLPVQGEPAGE
jgi:ABC-type polysaccharide/polyol phosphate transport system ATPase subunit